MKTASGLHVLHASSPKESHSDAAHKRYQKYDTHVLSNIQAKEIPRQSYTDNALQMQANWYKCLLWQYPRLSNPLSLGPVLTDVPPVKGSHVGPAQSLGHQVLQVSLFVSTHFNVQTTHSNDWICQTCSFGSMERT